jgi:hypothetical protein
MSPPPAIPPNRSYDPAASTGYPAWEAVVVSQLADRADLDPAFYLERMAAALGADRSVLSWSDLAELADGGQRRG